jgi:hypothetical protein
MAPVNPVVWMSAASSAAAIAAIASGAPAPEVVWGLAGPLAAASVTWVLARRAYERDPAQLTRVMTKAFAAKLLFFGVYVAVMIIGLGLSATPFALSFAFFFIGVHVVEALFLQRLFTERNSPL